MHRSVRMKRELEMFRDSPPHGITCWSKDDSLTHLEAQILGGEETPYEGGTYKIDIQLPERYPFEPPKMKFLTPIYHPNIDNAGRICLDSLKMPPKGAWKPALNLSTVLTTIQLLMAEPNPEDPLMTDISNEFKFNRPLFVTNAKDWTKKYAMPDKQVDAHTSKSSVAQTSKKEIDSDSSDYEDSENENAQHKTVGQKRASSGMDTVLRENIKKVKS